MDTHFGIYGKYEIQLRDKDGNLKETHLASDHPNLVTDLGMNHIGANSGAYYWDYISVGSGSTTPQVTDTSLQNWIFSTNASLGTTHGYKGSVDEKYLWLRMVKRFYAGQATGNISEVGFGRSSDGTNLFSRALVVDEFGDPTTITVLADEVLDVTYELRIYIQDFIDEGQITFTGNLGGTYNYIFKPSGLGDTDGSYAFNSTNWSIQGYFNDVTKIGPLMYGMSHYSGASTSYRYPQITVYHGDYTAGSYSGSPEIINGSPNASSTHYVEGMFVTLDSYVPNSFEKTFTLHLPLDRYNDTKGVAALRWYGSGMGRYQLSFDPPIPKTNIDYVDINLKLTWGRYTPNPVYSIPTPPVEAVPANTYAGPTVYYKNAMTVSANTQGTYDFTAFRSNDWKRNYLYEGHLSAQEGDMILVSISTAGTARSNTASIVDSGYTLLKYTFNDDSYDGENWLYYKIVQEGEGVVNTVTIDAGIYDRNTTVALIRGMDQTTPYINLGTHHADNNWYGYPQTVTTVPNGLYFLNYVSYAVLPGAGNPVDGEGLYYDIWYVSGRSNMLFKYTDGTDLSPATLTGTGTINTYVDVDVNWFVLQPPQV